MYDLKAGSFAKETRHVLYWMKDVDDLLRADEYITYMACAAYTTVIVTSKGRLLISGSNSFGELGVSQHEVSQFIVHPFSLENSQVKFIKVACGDHNIIGLTTEGQVYVTGYNSADGTFSFIVFVLTIVRAWIGPLNQYLQTHPQQCSQQIWSSD